MISEPTYLAARMVAPEIRVNHQHDAMAMVASQDGQFTLFLWSHELQIVHAQRIDYLLL